MDEKQIAQEIVKRMGKPLMRYFRELREEHGKLAVVLPGLIPHPVHFREGMEVRNLIREILSDAGEEWDCDKLDNRWEPIMLQALDIKYTPQKKPFEKWLLEQTEEDFRSRPSKNLSRYLRMARDYAYYIHSCYGPRCCEECHEYIGDDFENDVMVYWRPVQEKIHLIAKILTERGDHGKFKKPNKSDKPQHEGKRNKRKPHRTRGGR